jgi:hypothetical protein
MFFCGECGCFGVGVDVEAGVAEPILERSFLLLKDVSLGDK